MWYGCIMRNKKKLDARATRFLVKCAFERKLIDSATFDALMETPEIVDEDSSMRKFIDDPP